MPGRRLFASLVLSAGLFVSACENDDATGPQQQLFTATLTGAAERPNPVTTTATGTATFTVTGNVVNYTLTANNLRNFAAAHIHGPGGPDAVAGVLVTLSNTPNPGPVNGTLAQGSFTTGSALLTGGITVDSVLTLMRNGNAYVNVHTNDGVAPANTGPGDFPAGEIRGQIQRQQ